MKDIILHTRQDFDSLVRKRDQYRCVVPSCGKTENLAVHHIIERKLWSDGGYYLDNGVTLCPRHHILAEQTLLTCDDLRQHAHIESIVLPDHFFFEERYDKWGNILLPSGSRIKGEMFFESQVQKILTEAGVIDQFLPYIKYPRTYHVPWSENLQNDDKMHKDMSFFNGRNVVVTEKLDGENTNLYRDFYHARSIDSSHNEHPKLKASRSWVKQLHGNIAHEIPEGWRMCGENMYAEHSIKYQNLRSYFYVFGIWNENNWCLSWDETLEWASLLGLQVVPVLYEGIYDEGIIRSLYREKNESGDPMEGYVIRIRESFPYKDYRIATGKFVRKNHVQTDQHWRDAPLIANGIINE